MKNRGGEDDEVSRRMWEAVESEIGEVGMVEAKGRKGKRRSREETRRAGKEKTKGKENSKDKKSSRGMGNLG